MVVSLPLSKADILVQLALLHLNSGIRLIWATA